MEHTASPAAIDRMAVCSWSLHPRNPQSLIDQVREVGLKQVQLALMPLRNEPAAWGDAVAKLHDAGICIASGMFGTVGEDYSSLDTIRRTGGFLPDAHWDENRRIIDDVAKLAAQHHIDVVSVHAGFIPHDPADPVYAKMIERLRAAADRFAEVNAALLFETGQETAEDLIRFLDDLDRPGVGVNFDPANMILYDKGDPTEALRLLLPRVRQVHIKDAVRTTTPGEWGQEVAVGEGQVDWPAFAETLKGGGYRGPLVIEREAGEQRVADIRRAVERLTPLFA